MIQGWKYKSEQEGNNYKLNLVKEEVCDKLSEAHRLIIEVSTTHIHNESLYEKGKEIQNAIKNPAEYISMLDEIGEKIEKVMQYVVDKYKEAN